MMKRQEVLPVSDASPAGEQARRARSIESSPAITIVAPLVIVVSVLYLTSLYSFVLFHSLSGTFSAVVSFGIFMVVFNTRRIMENGYLQFIGVAYFFVGLLTVLHLFAYSGMASFPGYDANLSTQLWLASRFLLGVSFVAAPLFLRRKNWFMPAMVVYAVVTVAVLLAIFGRVFPVTYVEGAGLTTFKKLSEYAISLFFAVAVFLLTLARDDFERTALQTLAIALVLATMAELFFVSYANAFDSANVGGHLLLASSVYLTYRAMIQASLTRPFETLFVKLKQSEQDLRRAKSILEARVAERTEALALANRTIERELDEIKQTRAAREASDSRLRLMLEQLPCTMWTTDRSLRVNMAAGAGLRKLAILPDRIAGMTISQYYRTDEPESPPVAAHNRALAGMAAEYETTSSAGHWRCYVEPLHSPAGEVTGVIGMAIDVSDIKRAETELRAVSRRLVEVQEGERRVIAQELHDQVGQSLAGLKLLLARPPASSGDGADAILAEAQSHVSALMRQVRDMSLDLRPTMLDDLGLLPALLWHAQVYTRRTGVIVNLRHTGLERRFPPDTATAVYRVIQEALDNTARHACVGEVSVTCELLGNRVRVVVEDSGIGFDPAEPDHTAGLGVMRERVRMLDGNLDVFSEPGKGTRIVAELPLGEE